MFIYKVLTVKRLKSSVNGNPRLSFTLLNTETNQVLEEIPTKPDDGFVYGILNLQEGDLIKAELKYYYGKYQMVKGSRV